MGVRTANVQDGNIGETLTGLAEVIHGRRDASPQESYTARLLTDVEDELLKKLAEEASEVIMACKDNDHDHIRYEAGDLVYHLLVTLERYGIKRPWICWQERCVRTALEMANYEKGSTSWVERGPRHRALNDARHEARKLFYSGALGEVSAIMRRLRQRHDVKAGRS